MEVEQKRNQQLVKGKNRIIKDAANISLYENENIVNLMIK